MSTPIGAPAPHSGGAAMSVDEDNGDGVQSFIPRPEPDDDDGDDDML